MAEENVPIQGYQCHSSYQQWLAAITLVLNPPFGSISFFCWVKSRQSLLAGKPRKYSFWSLLSVVCSVCGLLCTVLVLSIVVLVLMSKQRLSMPGGHHFPNYFHERFSNRPLPESAKNGTEFSELFENALL